MFKRTLIAAAVLAASGLAAPPALADQPIADCRFRVVHEENSTGQNWEGAAWGYAQHLDGGSVSVRCVIRVNGVEVSSTPTGSGNSSATVAGRVTLNASEDDLVQICAHVTTTHGSYAECFAVERTQAPPQEAIDAVEAIREFADHSGGPLHCSVPPAGYYPPDIYVNSEGDMWRGGTKIRDCPPYEGQEPPPGAETMGR